MILYILLFQAVYGLNERPHNLTMLSKILYGYEFKGQWVSQSIDQQFHYMTEEQGDAYMLFLPENQMDTNDELIDRMEFQLLNPTYQELRQVVGVFKLTNYSETEMTFNNVSSINYTTAYKFKRQSLSKDNCEISYQVELYFENNNYDKENAKINVQMKTQNNTQDSDCVVNLNMTLSLDTTNYLLEIILYCAMSMIICFTQFMCVTKLCKSLMENEEDVNKFSLLTVGYLTVQDSYICLQNLYFALINYQYFQYFILPAFFYFLLATTCDMKLIWIVWRSRHFEELFDQTRMRRALTLFFAQFYFSLIIYFILMYFFETYNWFICIAGLSMLPQIIHNIRKGNNPKFINYFIFGVLFPQVLYPVYIRGCPKNIRGMEPSIAYCMIFLSSYMFQILVLYIQFKLGPRSFIPRCFLPKQYNYLRVLNIQDEHDECAICLTPLADDPGSSNSDKLLLKQAMETPCKHWFHPSCLRSWIDIKMQCPTCRAALPPLQQ